MSRSTRWVFTINNYDVAEQWKAPLDQGVRLLVWQAERGAQGVPHLQGYIAFHNARSLAGAKRFLGPRAHVEPARGTEDQCVAYCTKAETREDGPWTLGRRAEQGARTELREAAATVVERGDLSGVAPELLVKYPSGFAKLAARQRPKGIRQVSVAVVWGLTGVGKTFSVFARWPSTYRPVYGNSGIWWDGYTDEKTILFDEFEGQAPLTKLLQYLDPYPLQVENKGATVWAKWERIIFTANREPRDWYSAKALIAPTQVNALLRRVGEGTPRCFEVNSREDVQSGWDTLERTMPGVWEGEAPQEDEVPPDGGAPQGDEPAQQGPGLGDDEQEEANARGGGGEQQWRGDRGGQGSGDLGGRGDRVGDMGGEGGQRGQGKGPAPQPVDAGTSSSSGPRRTRSPDTQDEEEPVNKKPVQVIDLVDDEPAPFIRDEYHKIVMIDGRRYREWPGYYECLDGDSQLDLYKP